MSKELAFIRTISADGNILEVCEEIQNVRAGVCVFYNGATGDYYKVLLTGGED